MLLILLLKGGEYRGFDHSFLSVTDGKTTRGSADDFWGLLSLGLAYKHFRGSLSSVL